MKRGKDGGWHAHKGLASERHVGKRNEQWEGGIRTFNHVYSNKGERSETQVGIQKKTASIQGFEKRKPGLDNTIASAENLKSRHFHEKGLGQKHGVDRKPYVYCTRCMVKRTYVTARENT